MRLSFLYPAFNRSALFRPTLESFLTQRDRVTRSEEYEILVVDDGSTDDLKLLVQLYAQEHKLPLRYVKLDLRQIGGWPVYSLNGANNPSVAKNVGLREAKGDYVVFSSPEVMHTSEDNLLHLLEWDLPADVALIGTVREGDVIIAGGPECRRLDFLARYPKAGVLEMGGFEEMFLMGHGWEDQEFMERWERNGGRYAFAGDKITAVHQEHEHPEPGVGGWHNDLLYRGMRARQVKRANIGYAWGNEGHIADRWPE